MKSRFVCRLFSTALTRLYECIYKIIVIYKTNTPKKYDFSYRYEWNCHNCAIHQRKPVAVCWILSISPEPLHAYIIRSLYTLCTHITPRCEWCLTLFAHSRHMYIVRVTGATEVSCRLLSIREHCFRTDSWEKWNRRVREKEKKKEK